MPHLDPSCLNNRRHRGIEFANLGAFVAIAVGLVVVNAATTQLSEASRHTIATVALTN